jgi:hypothetical protein
MSTSWKAICTKCEKVSPNPHPTYTPVRIGDLGNFIWEHYESCGGEFRYMNEYQVGYYDACNMGYSHPREEVGE